MKTEEIFEMLRLRKVKYGLIDQYAGMNFQYNISQYDLQVKSIIFPFSKGMALFGELAKLKVCAKDFVKRNSDIVANSIIAFDKV